MLQADPSQLRYIASQITFAADEIRRKAGRVEQIASGLTSGVGGWDGHAAAGFVLQADSLADHIRRSVGDFHAVASALNTLAHRVENINNKKQELHHLQQQRSHMHWGLNPVTDAEIGYLDGKIWALEADIVAESLFADKAAAAEFELLRFFEQFHDWWEKVTLIASAATATVEDMVIPALKATWKDIEEHPEKYLKKAGNLLLDGVLEFLSIPEMVDAWHMMTDSDSSWGKRLAGAGELLLYGALDISMFFGIGEELKVGELAIKAGAKGTQTVQELLKGGGAAAKAINFFARFGEKFGSELRVMEKARQEESVAQVAGKAFEMGELKPVFTTGSGEDVARMISEGSFEHLQPADIQQLYQRIYNNPTITDGVEKVTLQRELVKKALDDGVKTDLLVPADNLYLNEKGQIKWPTNDGFVPELTNPPHKTLEVGEVIDRFGGTGGTYVSPKFPEVTYEQRALPYMYNPNAYHQYEVLKPIPDVPFGEIAPAFGQEGGGIQYVLPFKIEYLLEYGYIREIF